MHFFTADQHYGHANVIRFCNRPFATVEEMDAELIRRHNEVVCHYALRTWPRSHYNSWQLHGHSHGTLEPLGKQWDVGVDHNGFAPVSFERICRIMENLPDNPGCMAVRAIPGA